MIAKSSFSYNNKIKKQNDSDSFISSSLPVNMMRSHKSEQSNTNYKDNRQNKISS